MANTLRSKSFLTTSSLSYFIFLSPFLLYFPFLSLPLPYFLFPSLPLPYFLLFSFLSLFLTFFYFPFFPLSYFLLFSFLTLFLTFFFSFSPSALLSFLSFPSLFLTFSSFPSPPSSVFSLLPDSFLRSFLSFYLYSPMYRVLYCTVCLLILLFSSSLFLNLILLFFYLCAYIWSPFIFLLSPSSPGLLLTLFFQLSFTILFSQFILSSFSPIYFITWQEVERPRGGTTRIHSLFIMFMVPIHTSFFLAQSRSLSVCLYVCLSLRLSVGVSSSVCLRVSFGLLRVSFFLSECLLLSVWVSPSVCLSVSFYLCDSLLLSVW